ncbi:MAG: MATE family efflux transporter, partial [Bulleidia sp.]|nr:MATE family efflux transporter [Bulleidia sp.]
MIKERGFYTRLLAMMLPLAIQELINFCVQILDTVMVGSLGDHAVSAVTVAGQPYFIFSVFAFGLTSAGAVMISQYWGQKNIEKIKQVMSSMLWAVVVVSIVY